MRVDCGGVGAHLADGSSDRLCRDHISWPALRKEGEVEVTSQWPNIKVIHGQHASTCAPPRKPNHASRTTQATRIKGVRKVRCERMLYMNPLTVSTIASRAQGKHEQQDTPEACFLHPQLPL